MLVGVGVILIERASRGKRYFNCLALIKLRKKVDLPSDMGIYCIYKESEILK